MKHTCEQCKNEFINRGNGPKKYCSRKCYTLAGRFEKVCPQCSSVFSGIACKKDTIFCSIVCASKGKKSPVEAQRKTLLKKYGVTHQSQLPDFKEKVNATVLKKFGTDGRRILSAKAIATKIERYGAITTPEMIEKSHATKLQRHGTLNFSDKAKETIQEKYNDIVSLGVRQSITERSRSGEVGFKSDKFKQFLRDNDVENASQLEAVRHKKSIQKLHEKYDTLWQSPFIDVAIPLFTRDAYLGSSEYEKYSFRCNLCSTIFEGCVRNGKFPRCLVCHPILHGTSHAENAIADFIVSLGIAVEQGNRTVLGGKEIDMYIPSHNIAIEFDGIYWHSERGGLKTPMYHVEKTVACAAQDIQLLHIFENEWEQSQEIVKSILQTRLTPEKNIKIFARKCQVREVEHGEMMTFFNNNHLQKGCRASIRLGLFYDDMLVQSMTFSKSRYSTRHQYEMIRSATLSCHSVLGGTEKLWKYFIRTYLPTSVISYADRRWFSGKSYERLGFVHTGVSRPNYFYFNSSWILESRLAYQKHKLSKILDIYDDTLTEWQNMQNNGYDRIWDCGHHKFVWNSPVL
jgi:hypothetical protein